MKKSAESKSVFTRTISLGLKAVIVAETFFFIGSYLVWRKMNRNIDFRYKMHQRAPYILEYYYKVGDKIGHQTSRATDYAAWGVEQ